MKALNHFYLLLLIMASGLGCNHQSGTLSPASEPSQAPVAAAEPGEASPRAAANAVAVHARSPLTNDETLTLVQTEAKAAKGDAKAQWLLGMRFLFGAGVELSEKKAEQWIRRAAEQGLLEAQSVLSDFYRDGRGELQPSDLQAVKWLSPGVAKNYSEALLRMGFMHQYGRGVSTNKAEAAKCYRAAADQRLPEAQFRLALMVESGDGLPPAGVKERQATALKLLQAAGRENYAPALNELGIIFETGRYDVVDRDAAMRYYLEAGSQYEPAVQGIDRLRRRAQNNIQTEIENRLEADRKSVENFLRALKPENAPIR